ncbi:substrate import-associated zinc metallohydrolase lipoprotein [Aquimarina agarivorans]|uniref:substrate import-associated zinc metallohydrolase lipoprotein n=1 Tax=Aquimarina agarivorans TaxID=980584 RepID=UPI000248EFAF|nr:substrate import-associated zinc metallohydrolase lipoprotein [Aquimarina agarivorans]
MKNIANTTKTIVVSLAVSILSGCSNSEDTLSPKPIFETEQQSQNELDLFLKKEFVDPFGSIIRYKFDDNLLEADQQGTPVKLENVQPIAELIKKAWITPYNKASNIGESFLKRNFPAEIVIIGSPILNGDGTRTLGVADSGVRVTLVEGNAFSLEPGADNSAWINQAFQTLHHEFAHIVDQNFNFDFQQYIQISNEDYSSPGTWTTVSQESAIMRGMVSPYATSAVGEDFAEMVAELITTPADVFESRYITPEDCTTFSADGLIDCTRRNEGRQRIQEKVTIITEYLRDDVGIDINVLRDEFLRGIE